MSEITQYLSLSKEELETAEFLYNGKRYRSCISRSYYAMFYSAQALLLLEGFDTSTHRAVIKLIGQHFVNTGKMNPEIGSFLGDTYELRQASDYKANFLADDTVAQTSLDNAKRFVDEVNKILSKSE
ncbi:hypothetical protein APA_5402 [Pseudanabaena sp. lw0831]|uniref:HEPN domain-containing protein n=1 Tax=Pseudanabaena sp. lw0831 TaxID=1357935 RepID=UPI0019160648|nr:HEPN domain-containing protein [Pseudanabaena sp. lw0831]GBO52312.1 hypothetical protein APA_5402 [Pseudanabaena sp. lw0831]